MGPVSALRSGRPVSFRIQSKRWHTPLDLPLGTKWVAPSRLSIVVGEIEEGYEISVILWGHAAAIALVALWILGRL